MLLRRYKEAGLLHRGDEIKELSSLILLLNCDKSRASFPNVRVPDIAPHILMVGLVNKGVFCSCCLVFFQRPRGLLIMNNSF